VRPGCIRVSQSGSYFALGCAVVNVFMDTITMGFYGVLILHAPLGIRCKILLLLICYVHSFSSFCMGVVYVVAWFNMDVTIHFWHINILTLTFYLHL
jgi:hypothetical protein